MEMSKEDLARQADRAAADSKRARERYEEARNDFMQHVGVARDDALMRAQLDHLFELGHLAGSSGESALAIKDVFVDFQASLEVSEKRAKERDAATAAHDAEHLELMRAQVAATESLRDQTERVADYIEEFTEEYEEDEEGKEGTDPQHAAPARPVPPRRPR